MNHTRIRMINTIAFVTMIFFNAIANLLPLGGKTTGEISANYPNLFTPAPYTFSIWGVIYILMAVFIVSQYMESSNIQPESAIQNVIGFWFTFSCAMNILWLLCWHSDQIGLSVLFMLGLLFSMIVIGNKLRSYEPMTVMGRLSQTGFQIYLGWICAATIANISVFLVKIEWTRFHLSEQFWTVLIILAGTIIGTLMITLYKNYAAALAIMWAYGGILVKHISVDGYRSAYPSVIICLVLSMVAIACFIYVSLPSRDEHAKQLL